MFFSLFEMSTCIRFRSRITKKVFFSAQGIGLLQIQEKKLIQEIKKKLFPAMFLLFFRWPYYLSPK